MLGTNRGIWCGTVVSPLELDEEATTVDGNIQEQFYRFNLAVELRDEQGNATDRSTLPVVIGDKALKTLDFYPSVGNLIHIEGSWRTQDKQQAKHQKTRLEQYILVKYIELAPESQMKNTFLFEGVLVEKLFVLQRDGNGIPLKDEYGRLIPKNGIIRYTVRKKDNQEMNDFKLAINRVNGSDYVPCVAYDVLANEVANEVPLRARVEGVGYIRARVYTDKRTLLPKTAYEAVVLSLNVKEAKNS